MPSFSISPSWFKGTEDGEMLTLEKYCLYEDTDYREVLITGRYRLRKDTTDGNIHICMFILIRYCFNTSAFHYITQIIIFYIKNV